MSITASIYRPQYWSPVYNDIIYQVLSDTFSNIDFKYIFDVNVNGTDVARYETRPRPDGTGLLNLSNFLQGYIDNSRGWIEQYYSATGGSIYEAINSPFQVGECIVRVGEAYRTSISSPLLGYNGVNNNLGAPSYSLPAQLDGIISRSGSRGIRFYNGYKNPLEYYEQIGTASDFDKAYWMNLEGAGGGLFRTLIPGSPNQRTIYLGREDKCSLTFWNDTRQVFGNESPYIHSWQFVFYNSSGIILGTSSRFNFTTSTNLLGLTGSTISVGTPQPQSYTASYSIGQIACGPVDPIVSSFISGTPSVSYYTLRLRQSQDDPLQIFNTSELITFRFEEQDGLDYSRWRFSWLNTLGGRDWYNFKKKNTEIYNQTRQTYNKQMNYGGGSTSSVAGRIIRPYDRTKVQPDGYGDTTYNMNIDQKFQASTDWVDEAYSVYLKGLFNSPHILAYPPREVGNPYIPRLVVIETTSYEVMDFNRGKVFNYTIDFRFSQNLHPQY